MQSANVFGTPSYVLEQQGFRKVLDTSFMIGFLINGNATNEQLWAYFNALQRAQRRFAYQLPEGLRLRPQLFFGSNLQFSILQWRRLI